MRILMSAVLAKMIVMRMLIAQTLQDHSPALVGVDSWEMGDNAWVIKISIESVESK